MSTSERQRFFFVERYCLGGITPDSTPESELVEELKLSPFDFDGCVCNPKFTDVQSSDFADQLGTNYGTGSSMCTSLNERVIPRTHASYHKGCYGKILVVGGNEKYVGPPVFACRAAQAVGTDLCYVAWLESERPGGYCGSVLAAVKAQNPTCIMFPLYQTPLSLGVDAALIGPGGGHPSMWLSEPRFYEVIRGMTKVIDADGLKDLSPYKKGCNDTSILVLTPNLPELKIIAADFLSTPSTGKLKFEDVEQAVLKLLDTLESDEPIVLIKGACDIIISRRATIVYCFPSSRYGAGRRPGGLGDCLAGVITAYFAASGAFERRRQHRPEHFLESPFPTDILFPECVVLCAIRHLKLVVSNRDGRGFNAEMAIHQLQTNTIVHWKSQGPIWLRPSESLEKNHFFVLEF